MKQEASQATETLEAMRFLWAMVGVTADVLELVDYRVGPGGEHFTCRNRGNGHVVAVSRQRRWTEEEERRYDENLPWIVLRPTSLAHSLHHLTKKR